MVIWPWTAPDVARAILQDRQRKKELAFVRQVSKLVIANDRCGMARDRMARVLSLHAKGLTGLK